MNSIVITGCHGLLGQKLVEVLSARTNRLHGFDLHKNNLFSGMQNYYCHQVNITERANLIKLIVRISPQVIINTAAMTQVDACEVKKEECWNINVYAVENLIRAARRVGAKIIHLSSDYVFNGTAGPYNELDKPRPISYYGKSKHASENVLLGADIESAIVRTMVLFGHGRNLKPSFVSWLVTKLREGTILKIVTDQIGNVTLIDDLANGIKHIIQMDKSGIYHIAGREIISRFDFAVRVAESYSLNKSLIHPILTRMLRQAAPRPLQSGLEVDKAQKDLKLLLCNVDEALRKYRIQEATFN
jgi:dTDP-4-dehydrorhamnose reductase